AWLERQDVAESVRDDLVLAVVEAATSLVRQADARDRPTMDLSAVSGAGSIEVTIRSSAQWQPPDGTDRGRSWLLLEALVDRFAVTRDAEGRELTLLLRVAPATGNGGETA